MLLPIVMATAKIAAALGLAFIGTLAGQDFSSMFMFAAFGILIADVSALTVRLPPEPQ